jgi:DNA-binding NtrC family response regulator
VSRTILVVDDDRQMVRTLSAVLRLHGWDTTSAYSGEEAVAATATQRFDAVLMDVRMPGINGVEALRRIHETQPRTPIILMTAYAAHELLEQAERDGAVRILGKPIAWPKLLAVLTDVVSTNRSVLVVDDDPQFLSTLGQVLQQHGSKVEKAGSLAEAMALIETASPSVVVLDLKLEDIQPMDAVLAIKELSPSVALILYSGHPHMLDDTVAALPSEWVHAGLKKPFPPEQLIGLLDALTRH